jgi:hypothetical protein
MEFDLKKVSNAEDALPLLSISWNEVLDLDSICSGNMELIKLLDTSTPIYCF